MPERSSAIMHQANRRPIGAPDAESSPNTSGAAVVALAVIALLLTVALLGRLGLLTDPMVWGSFALVLGFLAVGLLISVRRAGNPIGWLLLWTGVVAGLHLLGVAYGDLQSAGGSRDLARRIGAVVVRHLGLVGSPGRKPTNPCAVS
jgi:hypothetical protein